MPAGKSIHFTRGLLHGCAEQSPVQIPQHMARAKRPLEKSAGQRVRCPFQPTPLPQQGPAPMSALGFHRWSSAAECCPTRDLSRVVPGGSQEEHLFIIGSPGKIQVPGQVFGRPAPVPGVLSFGAGMCYWLCRRDGNTHQRPQSTAGWAVGWVVPVCRARGSLLLLAPPAGGSNKKPS